jgi:Protein of unknown function (DUF2281)
MEAITLEQQILGSIRSLPLQQQHEVLNFAQFLHQKAAIKSPRRSLKGLGADLKPDYRNRYRPSSSRNVG